MKPYFVVAKTNLQKTTWIAYLIAGAGVLGMTVNIIVQTTFSPSRMWNTSFPFLSPVWMAYTVCLIAPVLIALVNYRKLENLGVSDKNFFIGCLLDYVFYAAVISLIAVLLDAFLEPALIRGQGVVLYCPVDEIGSQSGNPFLSFLLQFSLLLSLECICHTLAFIQDKWYGWLADAVIAFLLCSSLMYIPFLFGVFDFILEHGEGLYNFLFFKGSDGLRILWFLALALLVYATNLFYLPRKK